MVSAIDLSVTEASQRYRAWAQQLDPTLEPADRLLLDLSIEQLESQELVVVVVGEFSVGKSSFLNALLRRQVLISDVLETTATVTFLNSAPPDLNAPVDHAKVTFLDGERQPIWVPFSELKRYTTALTDDVPVAEEIERVDLYFRQDVIPPGIKIVDSPGLNGLRAHHEEITYRQLALSHAAFFLFSCDRVGAASEMKALRTVGRYASNVLYIINKWDQAENYGRTREWFSETLHQLLRSSSISVRDEIHRDIFCISSKNILDHLKGGPANLESEQEFDHLRARIDEIVSGDARVRQLLEQPLRLMGELGTEALSRLEEELVSLKGHTDAGVEVERRILEEREAEVEKVYDRLAAMARQDAEMEARYAGKTVRAMALPLKQQVRELVHNRGGDILAGAFQETVQHFVNERIRVDATDKITRLFEAVMEHLAAELLDKTQESFASFELEQDWVSSIGMGYRPSPSLGQLEMRDALSANVERVRSRIADAERRLTDTSNELHETRKAHDLLDQTCRALESSQERLRKLGPRPAVEVSYSKRTEIYTRSPDGFFEGLGAFFFGSTYRGTREVPVRHENDSRGRRWDNKARPLRAEIAEQQANAERYAAMAARHETAVQRSDELESELLRLRDEAKRLSEDHEQELERLRREELETKRRFVIQRWSQEIDRVLREVEDGLSSRMTRAVDEVVAEVRAIGQSSLDEYRHTLSRLEAERVSSDQELAEKKRRCHDHVAQIRAVLQQIEEPLSALSPRAR